MLEMTPACRKPFCCVCLWLKGMPNLYSSRLDTIDFRAAAIPKRWRTVAISFLAPGISTTRSVVRLLCSPSFNFCFRCRAAATV